jgi:CheY-like chemotaxis protein
MEEGSTRAAAERPLSILLVEDHTDTAEVMADLLETWGHRVEVASSLAEARAVALGNPALDLVLSDLGLPDGSGLDLMRELTERLALPGIALSGYGMEEDVRQSRAAGFRTHLTKPVTMEALQAAIRETARGVMKP